MNKSSVRNIMLQHERTFKEQVQDLHKLYGKQTRLMAETSQSRGRDAYFVMPPPWPSSGNAAAEEIKPGHGIDFSEQATNGSNISLKGAASTQTPCSLSEAISDWTVKVEENPTSIIGPARKRKIDLEQPPEDESDGEMENSLISLNAATSCLAAESGKIQMAYSGFGALSQQFPIPSLHSSQLLLPAATHSDRGASGESEMVNESPGDSCIRSLPCIPPSLMNTEQTFAGLVERSLSFHDSGTSKTGSGPGNNSTMFSPHADLVDMASQETERRAHWIFQSPESNTVDTSVKFTAQKQQSPSPHFAPPEPSSTVKRPLPPHRSQRHTISKSLWAEPVSLTNGNFNLERHSLGASCGAQNGTTFASAQRSEDASNGFLMNSCLPGASISSVPVDRCESGILGGQGHSMAGVLVPAIDKGLGQGHDASIWSLQSPVVQVPRYHQQPFHQQQTGHICSQSLWVQSITTAQNSLYHQQQILYGLGTPDPVQTGYQSELLQRGQGDISGLCNMIGIGHYYSSGHLPPNSPPIKTPPKLVLKNDVIGMELKLVLPEKEASEKEKFVPKVPLTSAKIDSLEVFPKSCEIESSAQKDHGQDDKAKEKVTVEKEVAPEEQTQGSSRSVKDSLTMHGLLTESVPLAVAPSSSAQAFLQACSASVVPSFLVAQVNQGDQGCTSGSEIGSAPNVIPSHIERVIQEYGPQSEMSHRNLESEKLVKHRVMNLETFGVTSKKEEVLARGQINSGTKDMWGQPEGAGFSEAGIDRDVGLSTMEERNDSSNKLLSTVAAMIEGSHKYESGSFDATQQHAQLRSEKEDVSNEQLQQRALKEDEGSVPEQFENTVLSRVYSCESNGSLNADSSHSTDQQVTQQVSVHSTSTDKPSISRLPRWSSSKDSNARQKVKGRLSCKCKNKSGSPLSDKDGACASSPLTGMSDRRSEAVASAVNEDLQHDFDSDNLAASILLSFTPKLDQPNMDKQQKDTISEMSSSIGKSKPADQGHKPSQSSEDRTCLHLDHWNSASSRGRRRRDSGSRRSVDWTEDCDHSKVTMKDRHEGDVTKSTRQQTGEGDASTERFTSNLPRVTGSTFNDNSIPISRSKQPRKLNGVSIFHNPVECMNNFPKNIEAVHTPTGRRSSRGPLLRARGLLEGRSQPQRLTQHCVESSPTPLEKRSCDERWCL